MDRYVDIVGGACMGNEEVGVGQNRLRDEMER